MASGILNVNKPAGPSSFAVVRAVRALPGVTRVGHGGTLDPAADGVLPVLVNAATRLADFVHQWPKTYLATVTLGATSDTDDREGRITPSGDASGVTLEHIETVLPFFVGQIEQVPPLYSALKQGGEPLYKKARRGESVERSARRVEVEGIRILGYDASTFVLRLEVRSGRGVYIRSLAHDLGVALGCGGYLSALTRLAVGPLSIEGAIPVPALAAMGESWVQKLLPADLPIRHWPAMTLDHDAVAAVQHGQPVAAPSTASGHYRLLDETGQLVAWGEGDGRTIRPRAVFGA